MMRLTLKIIIFFITAVPLFADAQSFYNIRRERELIVTGGLGTAHYFGEMVDPGEWGKTRPNFMVGAEYFFGKRISGRTELSWFQLKGDDSKANDDRTERNLSFVSNNIELSATGTINLFPHGTRFYQRPGFNIYGFVGVGLLYFNPKAELNGKKYALQPLETEGVKYSRFVPVIPYGLGVRIKSGPFFNLLFEAGYRLTFTDHLDDASVTRYPDPATLKNDLSRSLSDRRAEIGKKPGNYLVGKRGNPSNNDGYLLLSVKVQYYLPYHIYHSNNRKLYNQKRKSIYKKRRH